MSKAAQTLENRFKAQFNTQATLFEPKFHVSAFQYPLMPVIASQDPQSIQLFQWGLIPFWIKSKTDAANIRSKTHNAKSETVFDLPSFRNAIRKNRCLVPAEGFFEWREFHKNKYPYYISLKDREIFSFAGISEEWLDKETGEIHNTFSILTAPANELMAQIHNSKLRMPVILSPEDEADWISPDTPKERIEFLTQGIASKALKAHTIDKMISSRKVNTNIPEIQQEVVYQELPAPSYNHQ